MITEDLKTINKEYLILKVLYFVRYFGDAFFYSFFQIFLVSKGLSPSNIGIVLAITPLVSIIANPFWNIISKDANTNRQIMRIITITSGIIFILMGHLSKFEVIASVTILLAISECPFYSFLDGFAATYTNINDRKYSPIRQMGSIAYLIATFLGGFCVVYFGFSILFLIAGVLFIFTSIFLSLVRPLKLPVVNNQKVKRNYKTVFTNKKFYFYMVFYVFIVTVSAIGESFFGVYMTNERNITSNYWGMIVSGMIFSEIVVIFLFNRFGHKIKDHYYFVIIGVSYTIRLLLVGINAPLAIIIFSIAFRGIAWGIVLMIHLKYLIKIVKLENITIAILVIAVSSAAIQSSGAALCGFIIEKSGYQVTYLFLTAIVGISTIITILSFLFSRKNTCIPITNNI